MNYTFNEDKVLAEIKNYIDSTYTQHYAGVRSNGAKVIQVTEFAVSHCDSPQDALRFNVLKYVARYGKKKGFNKDDLLKTIHYAVMMLDYHNTYIDNKDGPINANQNQS